MSPKEDLYVQLCLKRIRQVVQCPCVLRVTEFPLDHTRETVRLSSSSSFLRPGGTGYAYGLKGEDCKNGLSFLPRSPSARNVGRITRDRAEKRGREDGIASTEFYDTAASIPGAKGRRRRKLFFWSAGLCLSAPYQDMSAMSPLKKISEGKHVSGGRSSFYFSRTRT